MTCEGIGFFLFEQRLVPMVYELGRLFVELFLGRCEERWQLACINGAGGGKRQGPKERLLGTVFGKVSYWRTYIYRAPGAGYYPMDAQLGLPGDGFSMVLRSCAVRIATKMSYAQSVLVLRMFLGWSPSQKIVEEMVLGLGKHTGQWFESAPAPENDGDVLIIQIDSKASPTATEEELKKRRGKRKKNPHPHSPRHRAKALRRQRGRKKRKAKGDKHKNGKMATIMVMYTLKRNNEGLLEGPINKKVYASYAPKRHTVAIARREADKRGFAAASGRLIQIVTDGDNDLERYVKDYFPNDIHTIDVFHVTEYLWEAGGCLYKEGSNELADWVEAQKEALYDDRAPEIIGELDKRLRLLPRRGPGVKGKRTRLEKVKTYISKRLDKINYKTLGEQDLEISSGAVEGAVNHVIAKRFDNGGMRWIKQRAEALLQLRCIEINNDWDAFISYVNDKTTKHAQQMQRNFFLKSKEPAELPTYGLNSEF